jgi:hypothetical protein
MTGDCGRCVGNVGNSGKQQPSDVERIYDDAEAAPIIKSAAYARKLVGDHFAIANPMAPNRRLATSRTVTASNCFQQFMIYPILIRDQRQNDPVMLFVHLVSNNNYRILIREHGSK